MPSTTGGADQTDTARSGPFDPRLPDEVRGALTVVHDPPRTALLRTSFRDELRRLELLRSAEPGWTPPREGAVPEPSDGPGRGSRPAQSRPGRGPLHLVSLADGGQAVVRPFRRGGLVRRVVEARYVLGDRAFEELILLERLRRRELPVPVPLAAVQSRRSVGYRATLVTRRIPGVAPLSRLLAEAPADRGERVRELMEGAGRTVGALHAAGARHADLNAHNLLADPGDPDRPVHVVDFDRGRLGPEPLPVGPARRNLRRLRRSLEKLSLETALDHWDAFVSSYWRNRERTAGGSTG